MDYLFDSGTGHQTTEKPWQQNPAYMPTSIKSVSVSRRARESVCASPVTRELQQLRTSKRPRRRQRSDMSGISKINPKTNKPYKRGDIRDDGKIFWQRKLKEIDKHGFFLETWYSPERYAEVRQDNINRLCKFAKENKEKVNSKNRKYCKNNRAKRNANWYKYFASKIQRTPKWLTKEHFLEIEEFYTISKMFQLYTGQKYHVDHIVPLQGKNVSGLHVPWNLTVLPESENCRKYNKYNDN